MVTLKSRPSTEPSVDAAGAPTDDWTTLAINVFASKYDLRGTERLRAMGMTASFDTIWNIGYRADMDPELLDVPKLRRLEYKGRAYDIVHATQHERMASIELMTLAATS